MTFKKLLTHAVPETHAENRHGNKFVMWFPDGLYLAPLTAFMDTVLEELNVIRVKAGLVPLTEDELAAKVQTKLDVDVPPEFIEKEPEKIA